MALHSHRRKGRIEPIGPVTHSTAAPAGSKRQLLPEGVKEQGNVRFLEMPGEDIRIPQRDSVGKPMVQSFAGGHAGRAVPIHQELADAVQGCGNFHAFRPFHNFGTTILIRTATV